MKDNSFIQQIVRARPILLSQKTCADGGNMNKLLSANFTRMWKDKFFRLAVIFMVLMGIYTQVMSYIDMKQSGYARSIDGMFFSHILLAAIIISVLCSLFIGTEYSDGTMRNKIVVGNTRVSIYFSNLIVCMVAEVIIALAFIIPALCVGIPLLGFFQMKITIVVAKLLCAFALSIALTSIFTLVAMLCSNRAITSVTCILGIFILLFFGAYLNSRLSEPETFVGYSVTHESGNQQMTTEPNPNYLRGTERDVYEFLFDFTMGGQIVQLSSDVGSGHLWQMSIYSLLISVALIGAGIYFFRKKDLN